MATIDRMRELLAAQRRAAAALPVSAQERRDRLTRLIKLLVENADAICTAMSADFGHRSRQQTLLSDVGAGIYQAKHAMSRIDRWMKRDDRRVPFPLGLFGAKAWVEYQPKGVVGVMSAWNFPVQLMVGPIAGAFAAGNRVMAKCSEGAPRIADLLVELSPRYFASEELVFFAGGVEESLAFCTLPFDHLVFTGSTRIGREVMRAASENLVPVTLELGGKSPTIISSSADLAAAADRIAVGKMMNAGQICLAPDYVMVPTGYGDRFLEALRLAVGRLYPSLLRNDDYTSIIDDRQRERLRNYLDEASARGAKIVEINPAAEDFATSNTNKMPLNVVMGVRDDMRVMREEIFGPILPIVEYDGIERAIEYVNARPRPLGLYFFGTDKHEQQMVLARTVSGGVTINDVIHHAGMDDLPFGGIGPSGMGAYHGFDGFRQFSHAKSVYRQARIDLNRLAGLKPPYGKSTRIAIARALKA